MKKCINCSSTISQKNGKDKIYYIHCEKSKVGSMYFWNKKSIFTGCENPQLVKGE